MQVDARQPARDVHRVIVTLVENASARPGLRDITCTGCERNPGPSPESRVPSPESRVPSPESRMEVSDVQTQSDRGVRLSGPRDGERSRLGLCAGTGTR